MWIFEGLSALENVLIRGDTIRRRLDSGSALPQTVVAEQRSPAYQKSPADRLFGIQAQAMAAEVLDLHVAMMREEWH